jgi:quercetin dioxygenase-like cupin family protein
VTTPVAAISTVLPLSCALGLILCIGIIAGTEFALAQVPGRCELPTSQRTGESGCYVSATVVLGELPPSPLFWHLYVYPGRAAAEAASGPTATVVEALGKVWLCAIAAHDWRPPGGERVSVLGPLHLQPGMRYTAHYVEAVFPPGMKTTVHRHPGPEASYVISGAECVETPSGKIVSRAGEGAVVAEGVPMQLHNPGPETRRAVALILHQTAHHWSTPAPDWTPKGLCTERHTQSLGSPSLLARADQVME